MVFLAFWTVINETSPIGTFAALLHFSLLYLSYLSPVEETVPVPIVIICE